MRALAILVLFLAALPASTAATFDVDVRRDEKSESCTSTSNGNSWNDSRDGRSSSGSELDVETQCSARRDDVRVDITQDETRLVSASKGERSTSHSRNSTTEIHEKSKPCEGPESTCYDIRSKDSHNATTRESHEGLFLESAAGDASVLTSWCQATSNRYTGELESYERRPPREDFVMNASWGDEDATCSTGVMIPGLAHREVEQCRERREHSAGSYRNDHVGGQAGETWDTQTRESTCRLRAGHAVEVPEDETTVGAWAEIVRSCSRCDDPDARTSYGINVIWIIDTLMVHESRDVNVVLP
ncbi:MAG TPA: hypothetical protein VM889_12630 [Candidatus Thermoplasmatota archaeon]|nr:hypothetical protein [Candidatus Thermoplasmatota archaeon]